MKLNEWLLIPFLDSEILVNILTSYSVQKTDIENYYLLIEKQKINNCSRQEITDIMNIQVKCCEAILNRPTFQELEKVIHGKNRVFQSKLKQLAETEEKLKIIRSCSSIPISDIIDLQSRYDDLKLSAGTILPANTMLALTNIALGADITDIKKITKEKLLTAYSKARLYKGRPSDYVPGLFTDGDRKNIDYYIKHLHKEK